MHQECKVREYHQNRGGCYDTKRSTVCRTSTHETSLHIQGHHPKYIDSTKKDIVVDWRQRKQRSAGSVPHKKTRKTGWRISSCVCAPGGAHTRWESRCRARGTGNGVEFAVFCAVWPKLKGARTITGVTCTKVLAIPIKPEAPQRCRVVGAREVQRRKARAAYRVKNLARGGLLCVGADEGKGLGVSSGMANQVCSLGRFLPLTNLRCTWTRQERGRVVGCFPRDAIPRLLFTRCRSPEARSASTDSRVGCDRVTRHVWCANRLSVFSRIHTHKSFSRADSMRCFANGQQQSCPYLLFSSPPIPHGLSLPPAFAACEA